VAITAAASAPPTAQGCRSTRCYGSYTYRKSHSPHHIVGTHKLRDAGATGLCTPDGAVGLAAPEPWPLNHGTINVGLPRGCVVLSKKLSLAWGNIFSSWAL